jgi:N6-adenosine-specific RNA methylase IME4
MDQEGKTNDGTMAPAGQAVHSSIPRYDVVLVDPPWRYAFSRSNSRRIENQYPTLAVEAICGLRVPAADDAALFLWSTSVHLPDALRVMAAWGFAYRSSLVWDKVRMGCGYWARIQHELLLVGTKGCFSPPPAALRVRSVISIPRSIHSRKPPEVRDMIARWYPSARKLEMFARERVEGWEAWGNEVESDIVLPLPGAREGVAP